MIGTFVCTIVSPVIKIGLLNTGKYMATILYTSTHGTNDPTRATLPFLGALGALEAGHQGQILLQGEATHLLKDYLVEQIHGVGWAPLSEIFAKVVQNKIPIFV